MFVLKKIITCAVLPPGVFIVLLLLSVLFIRKRLRLFIVLIALLFYIFSIEPTRDMLMIPLESAYKLPSIEDIRKCDAYVVLGGGINENAPSIDGTGALSGDALSRVFETYRVYLTVKRPIIFSGGIVFGKKAEADISKKVLLSLGLEEDRLVLESKSKDTYENAKFVKEICEKYKFKKILLVTNAFHMKRSVMLFKKYFNDITPYPVGYRTPRKEYFFLSFFPHADNMNDISLALKEHMGILFYKLTL